MRAAIESTALMLPLLLGVHSEGEGFGATFFFELLYHCRTS